MAAKRFLDRGTLGAVPERGDCFQHRQVGLAAAVLLDALTARDPDMSCRRVRRKSRRATSTSVVLPIPASPVTNTELSPATRRRAQPRGDLGCARARVRPRVPVTSVVARGSAVAAGAARRRAHRRDEAVAEARDGLDEAGCRAVVAERRAQLSIESRTTSSVTATSGQTASSRARFVTSSPGRSARCWRTANVLGRSGTGAARGAAATPQIELERREIDEVRTSRSRGRHVSGQYPDVTLRCTGKGPSHLLRTAPLPATGAACFRGSELARFEVVSGRLASSAHTWKP